MHHRQRKFPCSRGAILDKIKKLNGPNTLKKEIISANRQELYTSYINSKYIAEQVKLKLKRIYDDKRFHNINDFENEN